MEDARAHTGATMAGTNASAIAAADAATHANAVGRQSQFREWIADLGTLNIEVGHDRRLNHELALLLLQNYGRSELLLCRSRRRAGRRAQLAGIPAAAAARSTFADRRQVIAQ